jgi:hypothetical protein
VYRFYCLETKKTYSLLPFFVYRYERHINTVIEDVLQEYYNGASIERLAEVPAPSPWTIRRWIRKFGNRLDGLRQEVEEFLINNLATYLPAAEKLTPQTFDSLLKKAQLLPITNKNIHLYGCLSYLFYAAAVQNPQL